MKLDRENKQITKPKQSKKFDFGIQQTRISTEQTRQTRSRPEYTGDWLMCPKGQNKNGQENDSINGA